MRSLAMVLIGSLLGAASLVAQSRELSWPAVHVTARLDADGRLHVREQQVMRFTGDWNGGERSFNLRTGQELALSRMTRMDGPSGTERELQQGDLANVDEFDWASRTTLRWRSRLPSDPPFNDTRITYTLEYVLSNILVSQDSGRFLLDQNFAFTDREGMIDTLSVTLTLDPIWAAGPVFPVRYDAIALPPGEGYVVSLPLQYLGTTPPASVRYGASASTRDALLGAFMLGVLMLVARLLVREQRLGRFAPIPAAHEITPAFLDEHVLSRLPEIVGAAWDDTTSAPEVAATLARLVGEKKLSSRVDEKKVWIFKQTVLHLSMEVPRSEFTGHERTLIDGLFLSHETKTDTEKVRKRYETSGFDPAGLIRARLETLVEDTTPGAKGEKPSLRLTLFFLATGALIMAVGATRDALDAISGVISVAISFVAYLVIVSQSAVWRNRVRAVAPHALRFLVPLALVAWLYGLTMLYQGRFLLGPLMLTGLTLWMLGLVSSVCNQGRARQSRERIALRKNLASAREFFREELAKSAPQLRDAWFPYLIAFGLGRHIDKWFRAFGGASDRTMMGGAAMASASSSSASGSSWTGFGGGGGFSGGGSSASFAAAVGGMAASVPSPSSSSSGGGGGGGGGGSSGGGGGGGW